MFNDNFTPNTLLFYIALCFRSIKQIRLEKLQKLYGFLVLGSKPPSPNPKFLKLSRAHKTSMKNIFASLKFNKMGQEAPEWPRSDLGTFEIGAPDPSHLHLHFYD
jgi:hypothetical protein